MLKKNAHDLLVQAMYELLSTRSIDKIKIEDILKHSGVSKATFYRYFIDKYNLRDECYSIAIHNINVDLKEDNWEGILKSYFDFFYDNRNFLINGLSDNLSDYLPHYIMSFTADFYIEQMHKRKNKKELEGKEYRAARYCAAGCTQILVDWLKSGSIESSAELASELYIFMPEELKEIFPQSAHQ